MRTSGIGRAIGNAILMVALGTAGVAQATDRYVATNATGTYDGSDWSKAYTNIQAALNAAGNGDTIYVAGHTFRLSTQLVWTTSGVTMRGGYAATNATDQPGPQNAEQWPTLITTSAVARLLYVKNVTNATLEYVTLTGGKPPTPASAAQTGGGVLIENSSRVVLSGCILSNNTTYVKYPGTPKGGGLGAVNSDVTLTNCILRKNIASDDHAGAAYAQGGGIWSSGSLAIYDSRILENTVSSTYDGWGGALYFSGTNLVMKNVLVVQNMASHTNAGIYVAGGTGTLVNCTVADQYAGAGVTRAGGTVAMTNCIVWHNNLDVAGTVLAGYCNVGSTNFGGNNISADPLFVAGYYLATNSPCVNAGSDTAANLGLTNRTTRTDGVGDTGTVDMGWHYPAGNVVDQSYVDIYVATNGSDGNSGTNALQAFRTVTKALSVAQDGSRIHVAAGTYTNGPGLETFPLAITDKMAVQILGAGATQTVLSNTGTAVRVMTLTRAFRSVVQDLTVTGGRDVRTNAPNGMGGGLYAADSSFVLSGCIVQSNTCSYSWYGSAYGGGLAASGSSLTLTNCMVRNNTADGAVNTDARGGGLWSDGLLAISDCQFLGNTATARDYGQGGGLYLAGATRMRNTLIAANHASSAKGGDGICVAGGSASFLNCTVADHPKGQSYAGHGVYQTGGTVALTNCIVWHNAIDIAGAVTATWCNVGTTNFGGNNLSANPLFEYGYYLATNSPSVNAGSDTAINLGLSARTTRADGINDTGTADMGWHYPAGPDLTYADIYVATNGADGNSGTNELQAFRTVTKALSVAQDGSRVHVGQGTYTTNSGEIFPLMLADKTGVQILGTNAAQTILNAAGSGVRVLTLSRLQRPLVQQVTLTGGIIPDLAANANYVGGGLYVSNSGLALLSGCIVSNNTITRNYNAGIAGGGVYLANSAVTLTNCLIQKNSVSNNGQPLRPGALAGGIWSDGVLTICESVIRDNSVFFLTNSSGFGGGLYFAGTNLVMQNVLVATNNASGGGDGLYVTAGAVGLRNCTVAGNGGEGITRIGGTVSARNSILWANGQDATGTMSIVWSDVGVVATNVTTNSCLGVDPLFVDTTYYHLKSRGGNYVGGYFSGGSWANGSVMSPLIDAGDPDADWSREPDYPKGHLEMGAYGNTPVASKMAASPRGTVITIR